MTAAKKRQQPKDLQFKFAGSEVVSTVISRRGATWKPDGFDGPFYKNVVWAST